MKHSACGYCKWKANGGHTVAMRMIDALADLLLGAQCPGCDVPRWGICPDCASQLAVPPQHVTRTGLVPIVAANPYRPLLCRIIPRYKDDGALHIEQFLVRRLAEALRVLSPPPDAVLVHVPSRPKAVRERGFDHGARLAAGAGKLVGLRTSRALRRRAGGRDQQKLDKTSRDSNMRQVMQARIRGGQAVLIDDIVTTGASLREASRALAAAGVAVVGAAIIANADHT